MYIERSNRYSADGIRACEGLRRGDFFNGILISERTFVTSPFMCQEAHKSIMFNGINPLIKTGTFLHSSAKSNADAVIFIKKKFPST